MKRLLIILLVCISLLVICIVYKQLKWDNLISRLQLLNESEVVQEKDEYNLVVKTTKKKRFPKQYPSKAVIVKNNLFRTSHKITDADLKAIVLLLNDSSNYRWGEIGTPYFDLDIFYYDKVDNPIGVTKFSYDGQTYSYPHIPLMKWGMLESKAFDKFTIILSHY